MDESPSLLVAGYASNAREVDSARLDSQIGDLLLGRCNGIRARDETTWRRLRARDREQRLSEFRRIATLPPVL
jgi:hypothetical protein